MFSASFAASKWQKIVKISVAEGENPDFKSKILKTLDHIFSCNATCNLFLSDSFCLVHVHIFYFT